MGKKQILRQRLILGLLLIMGAALFTWAQDFLTNTAEGAVAYSPFAYYELPVEEERSHEFHPSDLVTPAPSNERVPLIRLEDIIFTPPTPPLENAPVPPLSLSSNLIQNLMSFDYLTNNIFLVDRYTALFPSDIDTEEFLQRDLRIDTSVPGPQVLIFHTHSLERFIDSNPLDPMDGVFGLGRALSEYLANNYGIESIHHMGQFDVVDGRPQRQGAYERMEPVIMQVLEDNPSVQVVIDIHRDGVRQGAGPFITYVDGQRTARIMFFNGLSRQNRNGQITAVPWLPNPYLRDNLNLSFQLQLASNYLYPGFARRVYLREFRYSLHMTPKSIFVEVGNQYNTKDEALRAMEPLADIIAAVILGGPPV